MINSSSVACVTEPVYHKCMRVKYIPGFDKVSHMRTNDRTICIVSVMVVMYVRWYMKVCIGVVMRTAILWSRTTSSCAACAPLVCCLLARVAPSQAYLAFLCGSRCSRWSPSPRQASSWPAAEGGSYNMAQPTSSGLPAAERNCASPARRRRADDIQHIAQVSDSYQQQTNHTIHKQTNKQQVYTQIRIKPFLHCNSTRCTR